ncbi:MAG: hypothetical protein V9F01_00630 [Chitinophagaceae bacterium]
MKKLVVAISSLFLAGDTYSQELNQVTFASGTTLSYFSLLADREVLIRISDEGKILEWGTEVQSLRSNNYYAPRLQPYMGRVEYYGTEADSVSTGKVKSIGTASITYYGPYETEHKIGKIKSIGILSFDYFTNYDENSLRGKLKFIGGFMLEYYSSFENEAFRGKLKTVGSTGITYYSSFDDRLIRGKVKSIGTVNYQWYTSVDRIGYGGGLKSGLYRHNIGSVTYIVQ